MRDGKPLLDPRALERLRARLRESSLVWGRALIALPAGGAAWERRFQAFALQRARLHEVGERLAPRAGRSRKEVLTSALLVEEVLDMF